MPAEDFIYGIGAVVVGIMVLTLFFIVINRITRMLESTPSRIAFKGVLNESTLATVRLIDGKVIENVRLVGFTDATRGKGNIPYQFNGMVILEHTDGRRTLMQAKSIRTIEVGPDEPRP